ncbi:MAG: CNNM domain-containing protein [Opitutales bacterium]
MEQLLFYLALAIGLSFLCSILEAVLLSLTPSYISVLRDSGSRSGKLLEKLKLDVDRPLAAILSLNTIAHTVGAAGVGAQAQAVFENVPFSVISGVLTLFILVLSEIIPKTLGATYWRTLAIPSAYLIQFLTILLAPFVWLSSLLSGMMTRGQREPAISRDEIHAVTYMGEREGVIDSSDAKMLQAVMRFQTITVNDIYTPRPVVKYLHARNSVREVLDAEKELKYSRYPVLGDSENILGYVLRNELLMAAANDQWDRRIEAFTHSAMIIPEQMPIKRAFAMFLRRRAHLAMVVDEFGSFSGVLTLEDVIESLIGHEIMDEGDSVEDLRDFARNLAENDINEEQYDDMGGVARREKSLN